MAGRNSAEAGALFATSAGMRPAQIEALAGTALLLAAALKRGSFSLIAFLGAAALITHATMQRAKEGFH